MVSNIVAANLQAPLTIGDVAARTGVSVATLREWERRHGFPRPARLPSGHRRFSVEDVERVDAVLDRQRLGLSLAAAIRAVQGARPPESSVFAAVAASSSRPAVRLSRPAMLAISRSIEDASAATGGSSVLVGSFQREAVFRERESLWRDLARGSTACVVLADFATVRAEHGIVEVPIDDAPALQREWSVAIAGPGLRACLAGWELLAGSGPAFEAIWTVESDVVDAALERVLAVARHRAPGRVPDITPPPPRRDSLAQVLRLMDRIVVRLDRLSPPTPNT